MHLTQKGQVTIPKKLRDKYGLGPNVELDFQEESGKIVLIKRSQASHPFDRFVGILRKHATSNEIVDQLRGRA